MKYHINTALMCLAFTTGLYLTIAFVMLTFDPAKWIEAARLVFAIGNALGVLIILNVRDETGIKKNQTPRD